MSKILFRNANQDDIVVIDLESGRINVKDESVLESTARGFIDCLEVAIKQWRKVHIDEPFYNMIFQGGHDAPDAHAGNFILQVGSATEDGDGGSISINTIHVGESK